LIVVICGLPGVGKTSVANDIALFIHDSVVLSTDKIRKELISNPTYKREERRLIYSILLIMAKYLHNAGINCILDATFSRESSRQELKERLSLTAEQMCIVECTCPEDVVISRLKERKNDYSDADISIYRKMKRTYEPIKGEECHIVVNTSQQSSKVIAKEIADKILSRIKDEKKKKK
jgi:predicted kinase